MKKFFTIILAGLMIFGVACSHGPYKTTTATYLRVYRGIDVRHDLPLESVQSLHGNVGNISGSIGGALFFFSGSVNGSTMPGTSLQYAVKTDKSELVFITVPYADMTVHIDDSLKIPYVHMYVLHDDIAKRNTKPLEQRKNPDYWYLFRMKWTLESSTGRIIESSLTRVDLTVSSAMFNEQIAPLLQNSPK